MIVGYYKNYLYTTDKVSSENNNNNNNNNEESQYMVSHPETGSDSPIGSDQDRGRDIISHVQFRSNQKTLERYPTYIALSQRNYRYGLILFK